MAQPVQHFLSAHTLEADSILLEYRHHKVLQNIYIKVERGEIIGLLGRNGSGKSSLLEVIYGIRSAQYSCIRVDGIFIDKVYARQNLAAYLPQRKFVPKHLKTAQAFDCYQCNVAEVLAYFPEIETVLSSRLAELSGGWQRLIETVMVISTPSAFILMDEPFSNLMPLHVDVLKKWLSDIKTKKGIIITDHYYRDVLEMSNKVYHLNLNGRLIQLEKPEQELRDLGYIH